MYWVEVKNGRGVLLAYTHGNITHTCNPEYHEHSYTHTIPLHTHSPHSHISQPNSSATTTKSPTYAHSPAPHHTPPQHHTPIQQAQPPMLPLQPIVSECMCLPLVPTAVWQASRGTQGRCCPWMPGVYGRRGSRCCWRPGVRIIACACGACQR